MKRGYSLIELIVVFTIIAIVLPALFAIFFMVIRMQLELTGFAYLRKEGDRIKQEIIRTIRNSGSSTQTDCSLLSDYQSSVCVAVVGSAYPTGFDVFGYRLRKFASNSTTYMTEAQGSGLYYIQFADPSDPDLPVENDGIMTQATNKSVYVEYTIIAVPSATFVRAQSLTYRFLVTLRK